MWMKRTGPAQMSLELRRLRLLGEEGELGSFSSSSIMIPFFLCDDHVGWSSDERCVLPLFPHFESFF